ncbi:Mitoregulin [Apodemus speciosus]|uniref:Mitoregulin n=1 Tax=Apodemus speciosus TaxID=105296 RepID=A0ABQ0EIN3_APOSI
MAEVSERTLQVSVLVAFASGVEAETAGQAGDDSEKAGPGLSTRCGPSPPGSHSPNPTQPDRGSSATTTQPMSPASFLHGFQERGLLPDLRKKSFVFSNNLLSAC